MRSHGKRGAGERDALAVDSRVYDHAGAVQDRSVGEFGIDHASGLEPFRPVLSVIKMQQRKFQHIGRLAHPLVKFRTADREQLLGAQADNIMPCPVAIAMPHGKIDVLPSEVDVMHGCGNPEIDVRMHLCKPAKAVHQPLCGKVWRRTDRQRSRSR